MAACAASNNTLTNTIEESSSSRFARYLNMEEVLKSQGDLLVYERMSETVVIVRAMNSILGENQPLFVVNGLARGRGIANIQNMDHKTIKSITVKKGLIATNRRGQLGNSGVIQIETVTSL